MTMFVLGSRVVLISRSDGVWGSRSAPWALKLRLARPRIEGSVLALDTAQARHEGLALA